MADIPEEAAQAAIAYVRAQPLLWQYVSEQDIRSIMEAAAPALAAQVRREDADHLRTLAARYRALPADKRAAGHRVNLGQEWSCDMQAMGLEYAADVLARQNGEARD